MGNDDEIEATVKREPERLIVSIADKDWAKAGGIAALQCEFADGTLTTAPVPVKPTPDTATPAVPKTSSKLVRRLEEDLKMAEDLLGATRKRVHNLQMKRQEHGAATLTADEAAELREKEKEVEDLELQVFRLEASLREERRLSSGDDRPDNK